MINYKYNFIYKTICLVNDKVYVGQHHTNKLEDGYIGSGTVFRNAVNKYGKENFKKEILMMCLPCQKHIDFYEQKYIKELNTIRPNGYNVVLGGGGSWGFKHSDEQKLKWSEERKGEKNAFYKKKHKPETIEKFKSRICSDETREKFRIINTGKKIPLETKRKMSEKRKGKNNPRFDVVLSREQINKAVNTFKKNYKKENHPLFGIKRGNPWNKGVKGSKKYIDRIVQKDLNNNILKVWESSKDIINYLGIINNGKLINACKNKRKYKGFIWEFESVINNGIDN